MRARGRGARRPAQGPGHAHVRAEAAERVLEQKRPGWRSRKHPRDWIYSLRAYAFPELGHRPVGEITTADILAVLTPIWHGKHLTARRVRQRIGAVMKWAVAMGLRPDNPAGDVLDQVLGRHRVVVQHMRALLYRFRFPGQVGGLIMPPSG